VKTLQPTRVSTIIQLAGMQDFAEKAPCIDSASATTWQDIQQHRLQQTRVEGCTYTPAHLPRLQGTEYCRSTLVAATLRSTSSCSVQKHSRQQCLQLEDNCVPHICCVSTTSILGQLLLPHVAGQYTVRRCKHFIRMLL
jgi:hypothetical protein